MFKKIDVSAARAARPLLTAFTEDLERRDHVAIPDEHRDGFVRAISTPGFKAEAGEVVFADDLVVLGVGSSESGTDGQRKAGAGLVRRLDRGGIDAVRFVARTDTEDQPLDRLGRALAEGVALANWRIQGYDGTTARERTDHPRLRLSAEQKDLAAGMKAGLRLGDAVNLARMVATTPPNVCHPAWIARQAKALARATPGLTCRVIDAKKAAEMLSLIHI